MAKNLLRAILGQGAEKAISFFVIAVLVHHFTPFQMGQFFLAISITTIVGMLTELGTTSHLVRAIAGSPDTAAVRLNEVLCLRIPLTILAVGMTCVCVMIVAPDQLLLYTSVSFYVVGQSSYYALGAVFVGLQRISDRIVTNLIGPGILLLAVPLGAWNGLLFRDVLIIYASSSVIMIIITSAWLFRHIDFRLFIPSSQAMKNTLGSALPIFALTVLAMIHARTDEIMLAIFRNYEEVAVYATGYKLLEVSRTAIRPVTLVLFPILAAAATAHAWRDFRTTAAKLVVGSISIGLCLAVCMMPLASWLIPIAFGDQYDKTITITRILFLSAPALFLSHAVILIANSMKLVKSALITLICSVVANVLLNAMIIPTYGAIGAAWTTLATESAAALGILVIVTRAVSRKVAAVRD